MATGALATVFFCHGSRNPAWRVPFEQLLEEYRRANPRQPARLAFLELMSPSLPEVLEELVDAGCLDVEVHPLFLAAGSHTSDDLPALVARARARHSRLTVTVMPALLESPAIRAALVAAVAPRPSQQSRQE